MKLVYICSPYRAEDEETLQRNINYARELTHIVLTEWGEAAVAPHLYMTQCLNEIDEAERQCGLAAGQAIIDKCETMLVGRRFGISEGMAGEIKRAREKGICIIHHD